MVVVGSMHAAVQPTELRDTGISVLGAMPWSSHVSLFYESTADLLDVVVPFFKAGIAGGELCVWIPPDPTVEKDAERALNDLRSEQRSLRDPPPGRKRRLVRLGRAAPVAGGLHPAIENPDQGPVPDPVHDAVEPLVLVIGVAFAFEVVLEGQDVVSARSRAPCSGS